MKKIKLLSLLFLMALFGNAYSADHVVKMLNNGDDGMFVFDPPALKIKAGDTVTWDGDPFHNSASIKRMMPDGAKPWNGKLTKKKGEKSITVKFDVEGVYGYKCTPHAMLGMVGLIAVGDSLTNLKAAKEATQTIAGGKARFKKYFSLIESK
jgi:pseudoazurin